MSYCSLVQRNPTTQFYLQVHARLRCRGLLFLLWGHQTLDVQRALAALVYL